VKACLQYTPKQLLTVEICFPLFYTLLIKTGSGQSPLYLSGTAHCFKLAPGTETLEVVCSFDGVLSGEGENTWDS